MLLSNFCSLFTPISLVRVLMQSAENVVNCTLIQWLLVTLGITILNKMWPCNLDKSPLSNVKTNVSEVVIEEFNHTEKSLFVLGMCCHEPANCSSVPAPLTQSFQESQTDSLWNLWWYFRWWCQQDAVRGVCSPFPPRNTIFDNHLQMTGSPFVQPPSLMMRSQHSFGAKTWE